MRERKRQSERDIEIGYEREKETQRQDMREREREKGKGNERDIEIGYEREKGKEIQRQDMKGYIERKDQKRRERERERERIIQVREKVTAAVGHRLVAGPILSFDLTLFELTTPPPLPPLEIQDQEKEKERKLFLSTLLTKFIRSDYFRSKHIKTRLKH